MCQGWLVRKTGILQPVGVFNLRVGHGVPAGICCDGFVQTRVLFEGDKAMHELCPGRVTEHTVQRGLVVGFFFHVVENSLDHGVRPLFFRKGFVILEHISLDIFTCGIVSGRKFQRQCNHFPVVKMFHPGCQIVIGISGCARQDKHDGHFLDVPFRDIEVNVYRLVL